MLEPAASKGNLKLMLSWRKYFKQKTSHNSIISKFCTSIEIPNFFIEVIYVLVSSPLRYKMFFLHLLFLSSIKQYLIV